MFVQSQTKPHSVTKNLGYNFSSLKWMCPNGETDECYRTKYYPTIKTNYFKAPIEYLMFFEHN